MRVSATDFRVHLKDLGNQVARGGAAVVVERHGLELGVFINHDEYARFLAWRGAQAGEAEVKEVVRVPPAHPEELPTEEIERIHDATDDATDEYTERWRRWARQTLSARRYFQERGPPS